MRIIESDEYADWLDKIKNTVAATRISYRFIKWRESNTITGDAKSLGEGLYEARFHFGPGYRVYFATKQERIILLVFAGDKSSQSKDIKKARTILTRYEQEGQW